MTQETPPPSAGSDASAQLAELTQKAEATLAAAVAASEATARREAALLAAETAAASLREKLSADVAALDEHSDQLAAARTEITEAKERVESAASDVSVAS